MKSNFVLLIVLICNIAASFAAGLESGKKYRIESNFDLNNYQRSGALGLGAYHEGSSTSFYVKGGNFTEDCWWTFEQQTDGTYLIKNALSGEYMSAVKKWEDIKMTAEPTKYAYWNINKDCGRLSLFVKGGENLFLHFGNSHEDMEHASASRGGAASPYALFNFYDESGNRVDPMDLDDKVYCGTNAEIPARISLMSNYANNIKINGKLIFATYDPTEWLPSYWLASKPDSGAVAFDFDPAITGTTLTLLDGATPVVNAADIQTGKEYTLAASVNGVTAQKSKIQFTSMPIIDIRHEGKLSTGMQEYVWGETTITSTEQPGNVILSSRYKTRGATAAQYSKQSLNIKFRNRDTDEEEDTTLFGLRSSSSWILDAMAIDRINMRNRVCFDIWNEFSKLPYETKFDSRCGTVGKFVEVVINGVYRGTYCLTDRINRKLLDLKKPETDSLTGERSARGLLYKSGSWDYTGLNASEINDYTTYFGDTRNSAYWCNWELAEPEDVPGEATWEPLRALYQNEGNLIYYKTHFYINNVRDYHLFILALQILDNGNKNEFFAVQNIKKTGDKARFFICPWDMDASLSGNYDGSSLGGEYYISDIKNARINKNHPFCDLVSDAEYFTDMKLRWKDARTNVLSRLNLEKKMKAYADEFINSGAWARETLVFGTTTDNLSGSALIEDLNAEIEAILSWYDQQIYRIDDYFGIYHVGYDNISADQEKSNQIYDIFGRKLKEAPERGIFIRGGKANLIVK